VILPIWAYGVAALALAGGGFVAGVKATNNHWKAEMLDAARDHAELIRDANERNNDLARELEDSRANVRTVYKTITKKVDRIVDRPVYLRECLDDDGLRLANLAIAGKAVDPGESDRPVSAPIPLGRPDGGGGAAEDRRD
jgi:hypothetical protein